MKQSAFTRWHLPAILWAVFILALTSYPRVELPEMQIIGFDKVGHFGIYFIFTLLVIRAVFRYRSSLIRRAMKKSLLIAFLFAIFDEVHQMFIPGRFANVYDAIADMTGVVIAQLVFYFIAIPFCEKRNMLYDEQ